jgi:hypothetical protein
LIGGESGVEGIDGEGAVGHFVSLSETLIAFVVTLHGLEEMGEEVVLQIVQVMEDSVLVKYASEEEKEPEQAQPEQAAAPAPEMAGGGGGGGGAMGSMYG